jgi:hypothetical protein
LGDLSNALNPPWTTSTYAGSLWADWGFVGVIVGGLLIGMLALTAYGLARRTGRFSFQLLAGYLSFLAIFGVYTNLFTQQPDWLIVGPLLFVVGEVATRPGDRAGRHRGYSPAVAITALAARRRTRIAALAVGGVLALAVAGLVLNSVLPEGSEHGPPPIEEVLRSKIPPSAFAGATVLTDGDGEAENESVWTARRLRGRVILDEWRLDPKRAKRVGTHRLSLPGASPDAALDVGRWGRRRQPALFAIEETGSVVTVRGYAIGSGRLLVQGSTRLPPKARDATRKFMVAINAGLRPDLFAVDHGSLLERVQILVVPGERGFRGLPTSVRLPFRGISPKNWRVDVGLHDGVSADFMAFRTRHDDARRSEVHIATAETGFGYFSFEREVELPLDLPAATKLLSGRFRSSAAVYAVDTNDGSVQVFPLVAAPPAL